MMRTMKSLPRFIAIALFLTTLLTISVSVWTPSPVAAQSRKARKAKKVFKQGQVFFEKGQYQEAATRFLKAFQIDPHPVIMYNVGRAYEEGGQLVKSLQSYRKAIGLKPSPTIEQELTTKIKEVELFLRAEGVNVFDLDNADWAPKARLTVVSDPSGAEVIVNGNRLGLTPVTNHLIPQGVATIEINRSGYQPEVRELTVIAGRSYTVSPELIEDNANALPSAYGMLVVTAPRRGLTVFVDREPVATTPMGELEVKVGDHTISVEGDDFPTYDETVTVLAGEVTRVFATFPEPVIIKQEETEIMTDAQWGWTTMIAGAVLAGTGAVFGVVALGDASVYQNDRGSIGRAAHRDSAATNALIADILFGSGAAVASVGGVLLWLAGQEPEDDPDSYSEELVIGPSFRFVPVVTLGGAGAAATLTW